MTLGQIAEQVIKDCLSDLKVPSNDNLTLMIIDVAAYYTENKKDQPESPVKAAFKQGAYKLRMREMQSDAGLTESAAYNNSSEGMAPGF